MGWGASDFNFGGMTTAMGNTQPMGAGNPFPITPFVSDPGSVAPVAGDYSSLSALAAPALGGAGGGAGGAAGGLGGMGTLGKVGVGLQALQSLAGMWMGMKQLSLAKKQFRFQKDITNTNLANQIKSYNTALSDRARSRGFTEGQSQSQIDGYVRDNSMSRNPNG
jgi:hypothetical protein